MKFIAMVAALVLSGCGGGVPETVVSFYGDSITEFQVPKIAQGDFVALDYAVGGKHSSSPLDPGDYASTVVLRYGMADAAHGLTPGQTRSNLLARKSEAQALGKRVVIVNVSRTPTCLECATNAAIADITDIDVHDIEGLTLDGIHPDDAFYARLDQRIHDRLVQMLGLR